MKRINKPQKVTFTLIILIMIIAGCGLSKEKPISLSINLNNQDIVSINDFFTDVKVIQLESTAESIIGGIMKIEYYKGFYYIFDYIQRTILCFDENGSYVYKLSAQGKGPAEYVSFSDFTIDRYNEKIILVSGMLQEITIFDLQGNFVEKKQVGLEIPIGINWVYSLNKSTLLLTSLNHYQIVFYCLEKGEIIHKDIKIPPIDNLQRTSALYPNQYNTYQFNNRTFVLPYMEQTLYDYTDIAPVEHFCFDFKKNNITKNQIEIFHDALADKNIHSTFQLHEIVGRNRYLKNHIFKVLESNRYVIALVAADNDIKHVIIDKVDNSSYVFNKFKEDVTININSGLIENNYLITYSSMKAPIEKIKEKHEHLYSYFVANNFDYNSLSNECKSIIDKHKPETDNSFLVLYKFKE